MTAEEVFWSLGDKYGDEFNWHMLSYIDKTYVAELKKEIGKTHFLYEKRIWAVAKCDSNDDVLYLVDNDDGTGIYYIFHLTYSKQNADGFPAYKKFEDIEAVKKHIDEIFITEYM